MTEEWRSQVFFVPLYLHLCKLDIRPDIGAVLMYAEQLSAFCRIGEFANIKQGRTS